MNSSPHNVSGSKPSGDQMADLVIQARDGNRPAFEQLIDHYQGDIYRLIYYRIPARSAGTGFKGRFLATR
jgi:hypothetical protein